MAETTHCSKNHNQPDSPTNLFRALDRLIPNELLQNTTERFQARLLVLIVLLFFVLGLIAILVIIGLEKSVPIRRLVSIFLILAQPMALWAMVHFKSLAHAGWTSVLLTWCLAFYIDFNNLSTAGPMTPAWVVPIVFSSLLLNRQGFLYVTVACLLAMMSIFWANTQLLLPAPITDPTQWKPLRLIIIISLILIVSLCIYSLIKLTQIKETELHEEIQRRKKISEELAIAKEQAEASAKSKALFLATMSHELRTPLNGVLASAELLALEDLPEKTKSRVNDISSAGTLLLTLINDLLDLSKFETSGVELSPSPYSLSLQLHRIHSMMKPRIKPGVDFILKMPDEELIIDADEHRLAQIILNLVSNAAKFTRQGQITIKAIKPTEDQLILEISDTGSGISKEDQPRLFQEFVQVGSEQHIHREGSGLGLAIIQRIVDKMEGRISLESELGKGTTVSVNLPIHYLEASAQLPHEVTELSADEETRFEQLRVLVVDDVDLNRMVMQALLEELGITHIDLCSDGSEAVAAIEKDPSYDLILMDVCMPIMDGITACQKIRELNYTRPIIAATANAFAEDRMLCLEAGMSGFVSKPVLLEPLKQCLTDALQIPSR